MVARGFAFSVWVEERSSIVGERWLAVVSSGGHEVARGEADGPVAVAVGMAAAAIARGIEHEEAPA